MSLVNMKTLLQEAQSNKYGVGAFNVANMEMVMGVIKAAEEKGSPAIIQIAQARLPYSPLHLLGPVMVAAAEHSSVPIAVHFDHGLEEERIKEALDLGFTSVMIDASHLPLEQNIEITSRIKELAASYGASVEAEVGQLSGSEDGSTENQAYYSAPREVKELFENTGVEAIALSIGNAHGLYKKEPKLNFDILRATRELVPVPLVLHGGTGISDEDFRTSIQNGICKINIATANFLAAEAGVREYCRQEDRNYFKMSRAMVHSTYENAARHMDVFESSGKAGNK